MTVTSSCSRAMVHSDWMVYMADPSPCSANTGRSGHATAAPTATGRPCPIAPPVSASQSWRGAPAVWPASVTPDVCDSSETIAPSGSTAAIAWQALSAVSSPFGRSAGTERFDQSLQAAERVVRWRRQLVHLAAVGHEVALLAGVGEERHRRLRI